MEKRYKIIDLPDQFAEEIEKTIQNIYEALLPVEESTDYQVFLNSLNYVFAHFLASTPFEETEAISNIKAYTEICGHLAQTMHECYTKE